MAVNCCVAPLVIEGLAGVTAIEVRVGAVTVSLVFPLIEPKVAVIVEDPVATPVASPSEVMVATEVVPLVQVTWEVMLAVELSVVGPRGGELLRRSLGDRGVGRCHRDRGEGRGGCSCGRTASKERVRGSTSRERAASRVGSTHR